MARMKKLADLIRGFVMGVAEIVPGVSGSTLALAMGIYDDFIGLLYSVAEFAKTLVKFVIRKSSLQVLRKSFYDIKFAFGIPLVIGMGIAIALLAGLLSHLLETNKPEVYAFFFGDMIVFRMCIYIYLPYKELTKFGFREFLIIVVTFTLSFIIFSLNSVAFTELPSPIYFLGAGMLAISAMVLPGVSGSFIMVLLGVYDFVLGFIRKVMTFEISQAELIALVFFTLGVVFGFLLFVRLLKYTLNHYSNIVFAFLVGIMIASLKVLWPFENTNSSPLALILLIAIGGSVTFLITWVSNQSNKDKLELKPHED